MTGPVSQLRTLVRPVALFAGPLVFFVFYFAGLDPERPEVGAMAGIAVWMAIWWITEAVPLAATALLPLVLFPLTGVATTKLIAPTYTNSIIFLFIGGILIALAMERARLHRRIALFLISLFGSRPAGLLAGFMTASAFLSMWISNTATAVMMLPIGLAIAHKLEEELGPERVHGIRLALLLGIAYSCSVGGMTTPIGTPPNMAFLRIYEIQFPEAARISFGQWLIFTAPLTLTIQLVIWLFLWGTLMKFSRGQAFDAGVIQRERAELGQPQRDEVLVFVVFVSAALLWTFRRGLVIEELGFHLPGWSSLLPYGKNIDDGTVAMACARFKSRVPMPCPRFCCSHCPVAKKTVAPGACWTRAPFAKFPGPSSCSSAVASHWPKASLHRDCPNFSAGSFPTWALCHRG